MGDFQFAHVQLHPLQDLRHAVCAYFLVPLLVSNPEYHFWGETDELAAMGEVEQRENVLGEGVCGLGVVGDLGSEGWMMRCLQEVSFSAAMPSVWES